MAKRHEDAEKLAVRAKELLKELDPNDKQGIHFDMYKTSDGCEEGINCDSYEPEKTDLAFKIMEGIAATFPEIKLRYYVTNEGPLEEAGESRNGKLVKIALWETVVHLESQDDYLHVQAYLQNELKTDLQCWPEHLALGWDFDQLTEDKLNDKRLQSLGEHFCNMTFRCIKYDIAKAGYGDWAYSVSTLRNGDLHWENEPSSEAEELLEHIVCGNVECLPPYEDDLSQSDQTSQDTIDETGDLPF